MIRHDPDHVKKSYVASFNSDLKAVVMFVKSGSSSTEPNDLYFFSVSVVIVISIGL